MILTQSSARFALYLSDVQMLSKHTQTEASPLETDPESLLGIFTHRTRSCFQERVGLFVIAETTACA